MAEKEEQGIVTGQGIRNQGAFALVEAIPYEGYQFIGWYQDGTTLVSEDVEYRFCVKGDINLVAKFEFTTGHNQDIYPGSSVSFGFSANTTDKSLTYPDTYIRIGKEELAVSDRYEIGFEIISDWKSAFNGQIVIKNISEKTIEDWVLEFDFDYEITAFWTADIISHKGNHYIVKNKGYNANIDPGQSLTLGFAGNPGNVVTEPVGYALYYIGLD